MRIEAEKEKRSMEKPSIRRKKKNKKRGYFAFRIGFIGFEHGVAGLYSVWYRKESEIIYISYNYIQPD